MGFQELPWSLYVKSSSAVVQFWGGGISGMLLELHVLAFIQNINLE